MICAGFIAWKLHVLYLHFHRFATIGKVGLYYPDAVRSLVLRNTTANGGDMGAHVYWPWFLERNWFTKLRLAGWSPAWYSGFPIGQYYFPFPAVLTAAFDLFLPYNVAFKVVTVLGPVLLPVAAYHLADQLELPWPSPPLFSVATLYYELALRPYRGTNTWTIYGGNLASALAGEYSFTLSLTLALFFLATLAHTLRTGRRPWLPAVLLAASVTSHVVVALFAAFAGILVWLFLRPGRTWRVAAPVGAVALALSAVWVVPLLATNGYTSSMRYEKKPISSATEGNWLVGFPWWVWVFLVAGIVGAGFWRRRFTWMFGAWAAVFGVAYWLWPQDLAIWNTRFIPFYFLAIAFLAALGAAELLRLAGYLAAATGGWIAEGDRLDRLDAFYAEQAEHAAHAEQVTGDVSSTGEAPLSGDGPAGVWPVPAIQPPAELIRRGGRQSRARRTAIMGVVIVVVTGALGFAVGRAANEQGGSIASGWSAWNYGGYESLDAWPEYRTLMQQAGTLAPGRLLWEPSAGEQDALNTYGTSLALELLPYWTNGRIGSQEGLYFEASATKDAHFLTVSELAQRPSNPVRGLVYGTTNDFARGVRHAQMLGVRYLMFWTPESQTLADQNRDLRLVLTVPNPKLWAAHWSTTATEQERSQPAPGWKVYEIKDWSLVEGMTVTPVVARTKAGTKSTCWPNTAKETIDTKLNGWECATNPWWMDDARLPQPFTQSGPKEWTRADATAIGATVKGAPIADPAVVTNVREAVDRISFRVDQIGKPVVVKTSFFPNWKARGARGPWRLAPNLMVVIPTRNDVSLTYAVTRAEWVGRLGTLLGLVGLVALAVWFKPKAQWTAARAEGATGRAAAEGATGRARAEGATGRAAAEGATGRARAEGADGRAGEGAYGEPDADAPVPTSPPEPAPRSEAAGAPGAPDPPDPPDPPDDRPVLVSDEGTP